MNQGTSMENRNLQKRVLETLESTGPLTISELVDDISAEKTEIEAAVSNLCDRNLVEKEISQQEKRINSQTPIPISKLAFRGDLTPTQAIILCLYEERGYGQTEIAQILNYSPGNVQTNLIRIEEKIGRDIDSS